MSAKVASLYNIPNTYEFGKQQGNNLENSINRLESEVRSYVRSFPTIFTSAKGSHLNSEDGKQYIDFFCGAGTLNYGHNNDLAKKSVMSYIESDGIQHSLDTATEAKIRFLTTFEELILKPRQLNYKVQFTGPTGTNAVEAAIKLARKHKQRSHIIAFSNAYHGHTLGALALTGNSYYHSEFYDSHSNVSHLPFDGYLEGLDSSVYLEKVLNDKSSGIPLPAAIILETIQGEGGIHVASNQWLKNIEAICKKYDILLIIDDIQVGNGRSGTFFSFEEAGIRPDIVCLSKSLGGGLPLSINLINPDCDTWQPGEHTGTFRGNNLAFVAGTAVLEYWRGDFESHIARRSFVIEAFLQNLCKKYSDLDMSYRGKGMIWGLDVKQGGFASEITKQAFENGLLIESSGSEGQVLKIMAALTIDMDTLRDGLQRLEQVLAAVSKKSL